MIEVIILIKQTTKAVNQQKKRSKGIFSTMATDGEMLFGYLSSPE